MEINNGIGTIHIVLTTYCNVGCKGCYQEEKEELQNRSDFILDDSKKNYIYELYHKYKNESKRITISFFGGEPLLKTNTMINIIKYLKENNLEPDIIGFPTSGGPNLNLIDSGFKVLDYIFKCFPKASINMSLSYDGHINKDTRNISSEKVKESFQKLYSKEKYYNKKLSPDLIMNLIPQIIEEDYFILCHKDIKNITNKLPTFRIPHILNFNSNLDSKILSIALKKYLEWLPKNLDEFPKLLTDYIDRLFLKNPEVNEEFNWCQAGVNHFALSNIPSKSITECEFLNKDSLSLYNQMMNECINCPIKNYCSKPCLKSIEISIAQFKRHCTIRKIIFNEVRNYFLDNYKSLKPKY